MSLQESYWVKIPWWSIRKIIHTLWVASLGALLIAVIAFTLYMNSLPSLSSWHTTILENEFDSTSDIEDFNDYTALEENFLMSWISISTNVFWKLRKTA